MVELYIAKNSIIHKLPFFAKCLLVSCIIFIIYFFDNTYVLIFMFVFSLILYLCSKLSLLYWYRCIKLIIPLLVISIVYNYFTKNYYNMYAVPLKITIAIGTANLISLSTPFNSILKECEKVFYCLKWVGLSPKIPGLIINIVLRSIPFLYLEKQELDTASLLRGSQEKNTKKRKFFIKKIYYIFILLLRSITQTEDLACAIYLRGFDIIHKK